MYEPIGCSVCKSILYYPDEVVVGFWTYDDGRPESDNGFSALNWEDYEGSLPEGAKAYCLDCAPCECGDHEKLKPHRAENIDIGGEG